MRLPNGEHAIVDIRKLRDYCLNPDNTRGRHKARVFAAALGITAAEASQLRAKLLEIARTGEAQRGELDLYASAIRSILKWKQPSARRPSEVAGSFCTAGRFRGDHLLRDEEETLMAKRKIKLLDTVALLEDLPERKLRRGEVGTVVEVLAPDVYEVEFCDDEGQTYAELALRRDRLIALHNQGEALKIVA